MKIFNRCGFLDCFALLAMTVIGFAEVNKLPYGEINKLRGAKRRSNPDNINPWIPSKPY